MREGYLTVSLFLLRVTKPTIKSNEKSMIMLVIKI